MNFNSDDRVVPRRWVRKWENGVALHFILKWKRILFLGRIAVLRRNANYESNQCWASKSTVVLRWSTDLNRMSRQQVDLLCFVSSGNSGKIEIIFANCRRTIEALTMLAVNGGLNRFIKTIKQMVSSSRWVDGHLDEYAWNALLSSTSMVSPRNGNVPLSQSSVSPQTLNSIEMGPRLEKPIFGIVDDAISFTEIVIPSKWGPFDKCFQYDSTILEWAKRLFVYSSHFSYSIRSTIVLITNSTNLFGEIHRAFRNEFNSRIFYYIVWFYARLAWPHLDPCRCEDAFWERLNSMGQTQRTNSTVGDDDYHIRSQSKTVNILVDWPTPRQSNW